MGWMGNVVGPTPLGNAGMRQLGGSQALFTTPVQSTVNSPTVDRALKPFGGSQALLTPVAQSAWNASLNPQQFSARASGVTFNRPTGLGAANASKSSAMQGLLAIRAADPGSGFRQAANNFFRPQSVGSALSGSGTRSMGGSGVGSALRRQPVRNIGNLFG